jgi:hypothetical protein
MSRGERVELDARQKRRLTPQQYADWKAQRDAADAAAASGTPAQSGTTAATGGTTTATGGTK